MKTDHSDPDTAPVPRLAGSGNTTASLADRSTPTASAEGKQTKHIWTGCFNSAVAGSGYVP